MSSKSQTSLPLSITTGSIEPQTVTPLREFKTEKKKNFKQINGEVNPGAQVE